MNKKRLKHFLITIYITTALYILGLYIYNNYTDLKIPYGQGTDISRLSVQNYLNEEENIDKTSDYETVIIEDENTKEEIIEDIQENELVQEEIISQNTENTNNNFSGYNVIAKLEIPKIGLTTDVLDQYSKQALLVSVTKFWGSDPNEVGNFCISGHNYVNKNMFSKLKSLEIGDRLFLTDNSGRTLQYEIYDVFKVEPSDTTVVSQKTDGRKEVTLITCTSDSKLRIIIKSKEI